MQPNQPGNYWQPPADDEAPVADQSAQPQGPLVTMRADVPANTANQPTAPSEPVRWQASEYIHQEKNALWFVVFGLVVLVFMAIAVLVMQAWSFAVLIAVMAAAVIVYSQRPPRTLTYTISDKGLYVGDRLYHFEEFKSFGVIHDGLEYSVMLVPVKRFSPGVTVYFPEEYGEQIVDMLGARLPMQELHLDIIDRIVRKLRL